MDWMKLKSGSDVRGTAVGENAVLTPHVASCLGMAFARYIAEKKHKAIGQVTIALGRDSRISGPALLRATAEGIANSMLSHKVVKDGVECDIVIDEFIFLVELDFLAGKERLEKIAPVKSIIHL